MLKISDCSQVQVLNVEFQSLFKKSNFTIHFEIIAFEELLDFRESDLSKDSLGQGRFLRADLKAMIFMFMNRKKCKMTL